jgi:hypothetical protein
MSELVDNAEYFRNQHQLLDLRKEQRGPFLGASIHVSSEMLGINMWDEMIQRTQTTGKEFGVIVSSNGKSTLTSKIFEGFGESYNYDEIGKHPPSFSPPFLPHGLKSLYPRVKDEVLVHTHPIPTEIDHLPTTAMSAEDILAYANSTYNAVVMIDKGGVHMLTGRGPYHEIEKLHVNTIISDAFKVSKSNTNTIAEVRIEIAKALVPYGIRYYFSPDMTPTDDGLILLSDSANQTLR